MAALRSSAVSKENFPETAASTGDMTGFFAVQTVVGSDICVLYLGSE